MAEEIIVPTPSADVTDNIDLVGMIDALGLSADERGHFAAPAATPDNVVEEKPPVEPGTVPEEAGESAVEEKEVEQPAEEPDNVQKRIDKLTAEKYAAREEVETLKAQLLDAQQKLGQKPLVSIAEIPLSHINSHQQLADAREQALTAKEFALMNPNGGNYQTYKDGKPGEIVEVSEEGVRNILIKANRMLDRDIPARKEYLDQAVVHFSEAKKSYPALFDSKSQDAQMMGRVVQLLPGIMAHPDWPMAVGHYLTGLRIWQSKQNGSTATAATPSPDRAKIIGSPKGQAGAKTRAIKSVSDIVKSGKSQLSLDETADILDSYFR